MKMPNSQYRITTENDLGICLNCLIYGHCLIGGCLGARFHCSAESVHFVIVPFVLDISVWSRASPEFL